MKFVFRDLVLLPVLELGEPVLDDVDDGVGMWGERFFHISDPDGHELSFAESLELKRIAQEIDDEYESDEV